ncbi:hypothetical protein [Pelagibius sp. 7325]|uniref:hypothetical protein n=1 Tax=Pelagibius sp. 7325 TaxID=3131994 RepID=UPI0030ECF746
MPQPALSLTDSSLVDPAGAERDRLPAEARRMAAELGQGRQGVTIRLGPIMGILWAAAALIVLLSLVQDLLIFLAPEAGFSDRIYRLDVDTEASLPTWYSTSLLSLCALLLLLIGLQVNSQSRLKALPWFILTAIFAVLSLDEIATLHEGLSALLSARMDNSGLFYFAWTVPALIVCVAGLICFVPFILSFKGFDRVLLVSSAIVFLSGAIGMEMLGGAEAETGGIATLHYRMLTTLEETLEFAGVLLFLGFLLRRLRAAHARTVLKFE